MSYKLALIISAPFLMMVLLFLGDLVNVSVVKTELDALAVTVSYRIAYEGRVSSGTEHLVNEVGATLSYDEAITPKIGDTVVFTLNKEYTPFIMANNPLAVKVTRTAVVGYYDI